VQVYTGRCPAATRFAPCRASGGYSLPPEAALSRVHEYEITVDPSAIDANGHVNNVEFVRWMQDAAVAHADARDLTAATRDAGATWVVRSHRIEYVKPAFVGDRVRVLTWVADFRRAFSLRRYRFVRANDGTLLARGETDWVFVDVASRRPKSVPEGLKSMFELPPPDWEP
jgi:acyl-CoA thioester hydrolase